MFKAYFLSLLSLCSLVSVSPLVAASYSLGSDFSVLEDVGNATVTITRNNSAGAQDITVSTIDKTARGNIDFTALSGNIVSFADGDISQTLNIPITNDTDSECEEVFQLQIDTVGAGNSISGGTLTISIQESDLITLAWDDGALPDGNNGLYNRGVDTNGGIYCFKIFTGNADIWRTVLDVHSGEADLEIHRGAFDADDSPDYSSATSGDDGILLNRNQFNNGQEWYIRVTAQPGSNWSLYSGEVFVLDQGALLAETDGSYVPLNLTFPAEGALFFKATPTAGAKAWALWLNGYGGTTSNNQIAVQKNQPGLPNLTDFYDYLEPEKMLLVPPYFGELSDTYFVSIVGNEGDAIEIDSHLIEPQVLSAGATITDTTERSTGAPYAIYEVNVPINYIAWDVYLTNLDVGDPNIAVGEGAVASPWQNEAYSEAAGMTTEDSITLVPPILTNGTWFITVYSDRDFQADLTNGQPEFTGALTDIDFLDADADLVAPILQPGAAPIDNPLPARTGWYYFRASKIAEQSGLLGWDLSLLNQISGTEIAIRQNAVPGRIYRRNAGVGAGRELNDIAVGTTTTNAYDANSTLGFLQRPSQQADIWYVGIHLRDAALGAFDLQREELQPISATPNNYSDVVTSGAPHLPRTWRFYRCDILGDIKGWETRLKSVVGGRPRLIIRRALLPDGVIANSPPNIQSIPNGTAVTAVNDWFDRATAEQYRALILSSGNPLDTDNSTPITYYAGIFNDSDDSTTYEFHSTIIDDDLSPYPNPIELVSDVTFNGGSEAIASLPAEAARYFRVTIPANVRSWRVRLADTSGDARMFIRRGFIPEYSAGLAGDATSRAGLQMERSGSEVYQLLATGNNEFLSEGEYYIAVVAEQAGTFSGTLTSEGEIPIVNLGTPAPQISTAYALPADEISLYQFTVPPNALAVEIRLDETTGSTDLALRSDALVVAPTLGASSNGFSYGYDGGNGRTAADTTYTYKNPVAGTYSLTLRPKRPTADTPLASSGTIIISVITPTTVALDGGSSAVVNQAPNSWRYFEVTVPNDGILSGDSTSILAWNPRLIGHSGDGDARMVVVKGQAHFSSTTVNTSGFPNNSRPSKSTSWPVGASWTETSDFTNRSLDASGQSIFNGSLVAAWGKPLDGGTYYVGVYNQNSAEPISYTFRSETVGEPASSSSIKVQDISFAGGSSSVSNLAPRDFAVFRVTVPAPGASSWRARLEATGDNEANMSIRKDFVPDLQGGNSLTFTEPDDDTSTSGGGTLVDKDGSECYNLLPQEGIADLSGGDVYYILTTSEGLAPPNAQSNGANPVSFTIHSDGAIPNPQVTLVNGLYTDNLTLKPAEVVLLNFEVPLNATSLEIALTNKTGNQTAFAIRKGTLIPEPYVNNSSYANQYGIDYGTDDANFYNLDLVTIAEPEPGTYTLAIRSSAPGVSSWLNDSTVDLRIEVIGPQSLAFCGGDASQANQPPLSWRYFIVDVPATDAATRVSGSPEAYLGWDIGLRNDISGGSPRIYVRKVELPLLSGAPTQPRDSLWADGQQIQTAASDWTSDTSRFSDNFSLARTKDLLPFDQPLTPGTYYIGVYNASSTQATSYTVESRCVGAPNSGADFEVQDLDFIGGTATPTVASREGAYYKVTIPGGLHRTWRVKLENITGETSLAINESFIPTYLSSSTDDANSEGRNISMRRTGSEIYTLMPDRDDEFLSGGDYYLAVFGHGTTGSNNAVSPGNATALLTSVGPIPEPNLGTLGLPGTSISQALTLEASEVQVYSFTVPTPTAGAETTVMEIRLDNRVGDPWLSLRSDNLIPRPNTNSSSSFLYGVDEGSNFQFSDDQIITLVDPAPGTYTLTVFARGTETNPVDASADLVIENVTIEALAFSNFVANPPSLPNVRDSSIIDGQNKYYRVEVPEFVPISDGDSGEIFIEGDGILPILGWKITLIETTGDVRMRVMTNLAPTGGFTTSTADDIAIVVPPVLQPGGTYYIEVLGSGLSDFTIISSEVSYLDLWTMPNSYNQEFGDSTAIDLGEDDWHFYAIDVPKDNGGLLRTELVSLSGNPNLYIREDGIPTINHRDTGTNGTIYDRRFTGTDTEYANWVPINGRTETELQPGRWVVGVRAKDTNSRYQLKVSTGDVEDIAYANLGTVLSDRSVLSNDFKYYRFTVPEVPNTPAAVIINFTEDFGDVNLHLRDTIPPGHSTQLPSSGISSTDFIVDADDDDKNRWTAWGSTGSGLNNPGTYTFPFPNLRPGATYFIGMRGRLDGTYDLTPSVTTEKVTDAPGSSGFTTYGPIADLSFFAGTVSLNLAPGEYRAFRAPSPDGAIRWLSSSTLSSAVTVRIEQGTLPTLTGGVHRQLSGTNPSVNQLLSGTWPWVPGEDYYVLFINNGGSTESVTFSLAGEGADTRFAGWVSSFGLSGTDALETAVNNNFGINNLLAYALNIDPTVGVAPSAAIYPLPIPVISDNTPAFAGLKFYMPNNAPDDICYVIEENNTLTGMWDTLGIRAGNGGWVGNGFFLEGNLSGGYMRQTIFSPYSLDLRDKNFFRLRIELLHP